jgi:hypothetical protein
MGYTFYDWKSFRFGVYIPFRSFLKKLNNRTVKGAIFGLAVFIFSQMMMAVLGAIFSGMSSPEGISLLVLFGGIIDHLIYGITVSLLVKIE